VICPQQQWPDLIRAIGRALLQSEKCADDLSTLIAGSQEMPGDTGHFDVQIYDGIQRPISRKISRQHDYAPIAGSYSH
jgi:hypothetical protein